MRGIASLFLGLSLLAATPAFAADRYIGYVGTYTDGKSKGIYALRYDAGVRKFESLGLEAEVANPSFVATDPSHRFLYAVTERAARGDSTGSLSSYAIDPATGALKPINHVSAHGNTTAHLAVDATGKWLLAANYGSGSVAVFAIQPDGGIGDMSDFHQHAGASVDPKRQKRPHPHEIVMSADNRFLFVPDLGLDKVFSYRLDIATGKLTLNDTTDTVPGFGPRHMLFDRNNRFAYVLGEMGSKVTAMSYDAAAGKLTPIQVISTLPAGFNDENNSAELDLSADGRFLYATNRGHDSVAVFAIGSSGGKLTLVQNAPSGGHIPRSIAIDPSGTHLLAANQNSDNIVVFDRDAKTGRLTATGQVLDMPAAVCILFTPLD